MSCRAIKIAAYLATESFVGLELVLRERPFDAHAGHFGLPTVDKCPQSQPTLLERGRTYTGNLSRTASTYYHRTIDNEAANQPIGRRVVKHWHGYDLGTTICPQPAISPIIFSLINANSTGEDRRLSFKMPR